LAVGLCPTAKNQSKERHLHDNGLAFLPKLNRTRFFVVVLKK
jgi:hypothetical protein